MKKLILLTVILFAGICTAQSIQEVSNFSKIKIDTDAQVEIVYSTKNQVAINKDTQDLSISTEGKSLTIKQNSNAKIEDLKIRIYTNDLTALSVTGDTKVTLSKFKYQNKMVILVKQGAIVDTGDTEIKDLQIIRTDDSKVIAANAKNTKETVDGVLVAFN
ncbi:GIN domain-containing protein [Nonlabens sp. Asnod2-A12]|uniref:GIN domain-containing protein n=1 Tax=Nonlabens sp. Asnod2-A12 TaxID=3160578 RepID=UPI0038697FA6